MLGLVVDKTLYVLWGITQKQTDFMGELLLLTEFVYESDYASLTATRIISCITEEIAGTVFAYVCAEPVRSIDIY